LCEDGNEPSSSIKYGEIQKYLVELPSSAQGLSIFEVFSKVGDWFVMAIQPSISSFDYFGCNVIVLQDGQLMLEPVSFFE
jgi:hypothetical protein